MANYREGQIFFLPRRVSRYWWMPFVIADFFNLTVIDKHPCQVTKVTPSLIYYKEVANG